MVAEARSDSEERPAAAAAEKNVRKMVGRLSVIVSARFTDHTCHITAHRHKLEAWLIKPVFTSSFIKSQKRIS